MKPSQSYKEGKRGRHKRGVSPEARRWNEEFLIPERPAWMSAETYVQLARLRESA